ncbi:MAG: DUF2062 domain-containing protein [Gammaproteobacteria bacterium]|nr:MAG: DUF2062 domain-containing protein [Gammaproteobacteria bacterium]
MPRRFIRKYLPSPSSMRANPTLRPLGRRLQNPEIWHLHRRSVAGAVFTGLFCAFLPIPGQMLIAGGIAIVTRCNLPLSVALVWITNPITIPPIFFFTYKLGAWLLDWEIIVHEFVPTFAWLAQQVGQIWQPLLLGSLLCGWVAGVSGFVLTRLAWRMHVVRRWRTRRDHRAARTPSTAVTAPISPREVRPPDAMLPLDAPATVPKQSTVPGTSR